MLVRYVNPSSVSLERIMLHKISTSSSHRTYLEIVIQTAKYVFDVYFNVKKS